MTRIKLCGMSREEDVAAVNAAAPDMVGFVVDFPRSHRSVSRERLVELARLVDPGITKVGVFVDEPADRVAALLMMRVIDVAQLHGHESASYIARLRALHPPARIIQAFRVRSAADLAAARKSAADVVLLDNGQGTGEAFDWGLLRDVRRDFILAGGLAPDNLAQAVERVRPWGVDLSSGLETDRLKDPDKIAAAVRAVREADAAVQPHN